MRTALHMDVYCKFLKHLRKTGSDLRIASCLQGQWRYSPLLYQGTGFPSHAKAVWSWLVAAWPGSQASAPGLWAVPAPGDSSQGPAKWCASHSHWEINAPNKLDKLMNQFCPQLPFQNIIPTRKWFESSETICTVNCLNQEIIYWYETIWVTILRALNSSLLNFVMIPGGRTWLNPSEETCSGIFPQVVGVSMQIQVGSPACSLSLWCHLNAFLTVQFLWHRCTLLVCQSLK